MQDETTPLAKPAEEEHPAPPEAAGETARQAAADPAEPQPVPQTAPADEAEEEHPALREARETIASLKAQLAAERANKAGAAASTGSLSGGAGGEKNHYTAQEWDRLPAALRQKFIRSGKVFDFMKKWGKEK